VGIVVVRVRSGLAGLVPRPELAARELFVAVHIHGLEARGQRGRGLREFLPRQVAVAIAVGGTPLISGTFVLPSSDSVVDVGSAGSSPTVPAEYGIVRTARRLLVHVALFGADLDGFLVLCR
jgi:hypothetical protein